MNWKIHSEDLNRYLHLTTYPIGMCLFEKASNVPQVVKMQPQKVNICQLAGLARLYNWAVGSIDKNMICALGAACLGMIDTPRRIMEGKINYGVYQKDLTAAKRMQDALTKLNRKQYEAIMFSSLERTPIDPEVVIVYGNPAQILRLVQAALYHEGGKFDSSSVGDAGLCNTLARVLLTKRPAMDLPCYGERRFAGVQDHELLFVYPREFGERIIEGLEGTHKGGIRYPVPAQLDWSPKMPKDFILTEEDLK
ncbi:MAG: DUF169 domain-containing protein [Nitrososphaerales archaeon]